MYTHCRQFTHFQGLSDQEIRQQVGQSLRKRPRLMLVARIRNAVLVCAMIAGTAYLNDGTTGALGRALMIVGGVGIAIVLSWNLVWLNLVLLPVTRADHQVQTSANTPQPQSGSPPGDVGRGKMVD